MAAEAHVRVEYHCSPYYQHTALYPIVTSLQRFLQFRPEDPPEERLPKLERLLERYGVPLEEGVPLVAALLSLPLPERYPPLLLTPERQKQKTLALVLTWWLQEVERQPVCFIMEDLHWADASTLELLTLLIEQVPTARLLLLLLCRPEFHPPWASRSYLTQIALGRLSRRQVETMVERMTGGKALPTEVLQELVAKTDGVPLFVEELTKMVLESGLVKERKEQYVLVDPLPPLAIPDTLHDSLMARLDRLGLAKQVAQLGATLGREFSYAVLQAVAPMDEATLQKELAQLVDAELLYQRGLLPQARYAFKHALIQEAAYHSMRHSTQRHHHRRIAQVLETRFPDTCTRHPELVAHHYTEAGLGEQAIPHWQQAGQRAIEHSANLEAISHLTKGLEVLKTLPDTPERAQQELALQLTLGAPLSTIKGHAAPEVEHTYSRAYELSQRVGDNTHLFVALGGLGRFYLNRARLQTARGLGERFFTLAQPTANPALLQEAHLMLGSTLLFLGELVAARTYLEHGIAFYNSLQDRALAFKRGTDPGVVCLSRLSQTLWLLGYPDQALARSYEARTLAQASSHAYSMGIALEKVTVLHRWRREVPVVQERVETLLLLAREHGFVRLLSEGMIRLGWSRAEQGAVEEGLADLYQGLAALRTTGVVLTLSELLAMLAETYGKGGRADEGLGVLAEALTVVDKSGERFWEAELYRLKGELLLVLSPDNKAEAETCFRQALATTRHQQAKSLELRVAMSLSRLWQHQGKRDEARQLLEEVYGWFTEGFDTADLQEAKALLEELPQ
jgi:predicted ATPase